MLFAMAKDIRVLIILLSIVLYKMKNLSIYDNVSDRDVFVRAVNDIYTPLSGRLGLNDIKTQLENMCFKYLEPQIYEQLSNEEILNKKQRQNVVEETIKSINSLLAESNISATVVGRQKHLASIYKKMKSKSLTLAKIYDLVAVRVIVETVEECYSVLGKINNYFNVLPRRFKDYIAVPKPNGYKSLHTCIIDKNNRPIEVQIRTEDMHRYNEYGVAAHWIYKEKKKKSNSIDQKMNWFREVIEDNKSLSSKEFVENIKTDLFASEIFVQTPNGKIIQFPVGAICIDFAYAIHSDIGNKCVGAKINGSIKPISTELQNGDICEIITGNNKGPSRDWLKIVKTSNARSSISAYFRKEFIDDNIKQGRAILEKSAKEKDCLLTTLLTPEKIKTLINKYSVNSIDEIFAMVGHGSLASEKVINSIIDKQPQKKKIGSVSKTKNEGILVDNQADMLTRFAMCCTPMPGDDIIGFVSRGRGVTIHRADCKNIKYLESDRLVSAKWKESAAKVQRAKLKLLFSTNNLVLSNLSQIIDNSQIKMTGLDSKLLNNGRFEIIIELNLQNNDNFIKLLEKIKQMPQIISINRLT